MNGRTHLIWSLAIGITIINIFDVPFGLQLLLIPWIAIIGGLAPDLDHPNSMLGKKVKVLNYGVQHRGFLHSVWAMLLIGLLAYKFLPNWHIETIAFLSAYLGHLLLDTITPSGINWFYPWGRLKGPFNSDGVVALIVQIAGFCAVILMVWLAF